MKTMSREENNGYVARNSHHHGALCARSSFRFPIIIRNHSRSFRRKPDQRNRYPSHTNGFESAFDPIPTYWRNDIDYLAGGAHLVALVEQIRKWEEILFLRLLS